MLKLERLTYARFAEDSYHALLEHVAPGQTRVAADDNPLSVVEVVLGRFARIPKYGEGAIEPNIHCKPNLEKLPQSYFQARDQCTNQWF